MPLRQEWEDSVLYLTLDRPNAYNALDPDLRDTLLSALEQAEDAGARCVVIRGAGRGFCAGADLKSAAADRRGAEVTALMRRSTSRLAEQLITCPIPIIASVHGVCAGVGLTIALAADHCIASDDAQFFAAFTRRSLVPDGAITYLLPRAVGVTQARRILMFGSKVPAFEALALGMVAEVVSGDELGAITRQRAGELAGLPTRALSVTKSLLARSFDLDLGAALADERMAQGLLSTTRDYAEGIAAFRENRDPHFQGG